MSGRDANQLEPNCPECGSGILNGEHIANYPCSRRTDKCPDCDGDGYIDLFDDDGFVIGPGPCPRGCELDA